MSWQPVIGLEIHVQLATQSKIFSGASTHYGSEPNTQACPIDLGMPGVLPVLNEQVVRMALKFGQSIGAHISPYSTFARKNYFYPDLPKGYQISQYDQPLIEGGSINITTPEGDEKTVGITRAHLEEDAGKSIHDVFPDKTGVDLNRAGTPLLEIVTEPDIASAEEASNFMKTLRALVRYLDISDGNLQEGSLRCDANVSVKPKDSDRFGTRAEIKNVNSFRFVEKAINYEIERQIDVIENGGEVEQETRLYDPDKNETRTMRGKEEAMDYRYFPDPDLLPIKVDQPLLDEIMASLPELPWEKRHRFQSEYALSTYDANLLTQNKPAADYFESVLTMTSAQPKQVANWLNDEMAAALNKDHLTIEQCPISAEHLAGLLERVVDETISGKIAKEVFERMWNGEGDADTVIAQQGLKQISDSGELEGIIDEVIANHPQQVEQYQSGKTKVFGFFVGQVMKATQGKANPQQVNELLEKKLNG